MTETSNSVNATAGSNLLAVYLFNGDDELKRETLTKRLMERFAAFADIDMNLQVFKGENLKDVNILLDALNTLPFASPLRLVIIKDADKLSKDLAEALVSYLKAPNPSTVLALSAEKLPANSRLYKAIGAYDKKSILDASAKKKGELPRLVVQMAAQKSIRMNAEAAAALIDRIGVSTISLDNEITRLTAWATGAGKAEISVSDIIAQVKSLSEVKPWEFADALVKRDAQGLMRMFSLSPSLSTTAIFTQCVSRLRELLSVKALQRRGFQSSAQIAAYLKRQEWQMRNTIQCANSFSSKELVTLLREAPRVEAAMKSGADADSLLVSWLIAVCQGQSLPLQTFIV